MGDEKKGLVSSSMIELKAELFRKQEESKRQKATAAGFVKGKKLEKSTKGSIWSRQNPGVSRRAEKDAAEKESNEDEEMLAKSRRVLEEKAKLYEKITSSSDIPEEDGSDYYLVDFQKKAIDSIVEEREARRRQKDREKEDEAERQALAAEIPEPSCPEEEWVDFTDSLGRERRCMRKDLNQLMKQDRELALAQAAKKSVQKETSSSEKRNSETSDVPSLMSADMHRELMRQKWESETKELLEKGQEEIHYANVRFDEIRSHGVGFYQFSRDHEEREEQLEDLKKMREETLNERTRKDRIKDKRKAMMEARLAKVRQRRQLKGDTVEAKPDPPDDEESIGPKLSEASLASSTEDTVKKEKEEREAEEKRRNHIREWDKDKRTTAPAKKNYIDSCRDEREPEFAPPAAYFDQPKTRPPHSSDESRVKRLQASFQTLHSEFAPPASYHDSMESHQKSDASGLNTETHNKDNTTWKSSQTSIPSTTYTPSEIPDGPPGIENQSLQYNQQSHMTLGQYGTNSLFEQQQYFSHQSQHMQHFSPMGTQKYDPYQIYQMQQQYTQQQHLAEHTPSYIQAPQTDVKRSYTNNTQIAMPDSHINEPKKPKIPKMAIIDTRFVKNDGVPSIDETPAPVTVVPYTPGSFTAAKQSTAEQYAKSVAETGLKNQISGGPLLYTAEQQQQQKVLQEEASGKPDVNEPDADKKLQEFLSSIRSGTS